MNTFDSKPLLVCLGILILTPGGLKSAAEDRSSQISVLRLPAEVQQVLLVTSENWDSSRGVVQFYLRSGNGWEAANEAFPVMLGRNGMAWGIGPFAGRPLSGPVKVEGDGRSPAGIFELGDAFGYSKTPPSGCRLPYRNITELDYYIDDPESNDYNSWVRLQPETNFPQRRWRSFERMKLESDAYELGIIVKHNMDPAIPGKGSAIFLHLWGGPDHPTAACTAMSRKNFLRLLRWLDPAKRPVLIQVPEPELVSASGRWHYRR